jgi:hypothetical protein
VSSDIPMQQHRKTTNGYPRHRCIVLKRNVHFMDKKSLLIVGDLNVLTKWFVKLLSAVCYAICEPIKVIWKVQKV